MNRVIKFRAWDKKEKVMRSVDELMNLWSQYSDEDEKKNPGIKKIPHVTTVHQAYRGDDLKLVVGQDCDLMQFTGLVDKNGKEIFEGDIVSNGYDTKEVVFGKIGYDGSWNGLTGFLYRDSEREYYGETFLELNYYHEPSKFYVIGNIYENPDLQKGSP